MMVRMVRLSLLSCCLLASATLGLSSAPARPESPPAMAFPAAAPASCPCGDRFVVEYRELYPSPKGNHELVLRDRKTGKRGRLLVFDRHVEVLWAPGCSAFAVTDWYGSNASTVYVFRPPSAAPVTDLRAAIRRELGAIPSIFRNHHVYLRADRWLSSRVLRISAKGYGDIDPRGFKKEFDYEVGGAVSYATGKGSGT